MFVPAVAGSYGGAVTLASNDPDEAAFQWKVSGTASKAEQTITFNPLPARYQGSPVFALDGVASSGLPVSYASSNAAVATVAGKVVTITGPGQTTLTATQAGDNTYHPAAPVTQTLTVLPVATGTAFYRAINLNGEALTLEGNAWAGKTALNYTTNGGSFVNATTAFVPATDADRTSMIRSSVWRYAGFQLNLTAVPIGTYQVYLYVWEDNKAETYSVLLEGKVVQANYNSGPAGSWQKLGPFQAGITDGTISLATTGGAANFSGVEVWRVPSAARTTAGVETENAALPFPAEAVRSTAVRNAAGTVYLKDAHVVAGPQELQLDVAVLPAGLYLLRIDAGTGSRVVRFVKQ